MPSRLLVPAIVAAAVAVCLPARADDSKPVVLFNGKDLTNFYTFLGAPKKGGPLLGKNNDPKKVFTVVEEDGQPAIRVSGEVWGCFTTEKEFENYKLVAEFKWGNKAWPPRDKATRDSGVLVHCVGPDGAHGGFWMESIEVQLIEGGTGDFIVVAGKKTVGPKITCEVEDRPTGPKGATQPYYKEGGAKREFSGGRVNWWGRDPMWEDKLGFRGKQDVEKPVGEWNTLEVTCAGDTITTVLNGKVVNKATNVFPTKGKILFQSEAAEVFFRKIELTPLAKK
ncbi:MAG TPA: DUF1080 domain-containing protein [Fimbriiglobus sp.]|jgi:hypothetical protein|nr:DUF1080 domain-containing protein [Fimbriiglobus sp.]